MQGGGREEPERPFRPDQQPRKIDFRTTQHGPEMIPGHIAHERRLMGPDQIPLFGQQARQLVDDRPFRIALTHGGQRFKVGSRGQACQVGQPFQAGFNDRAFGEHRLDADDVITGRPDPDCMRSCRIDPSMPPTVVIAEPLGSGGK